MPSSHPRHPALAHRRRAVPRRLVAAALTAALALGPTAAAAQVLIDEVVYDGVGTDADDVFTELVGPPGLPLAGWTLVGINGGDGISYRTIDLTGAIVPADGVLVIATADLADSLVAARDFIGAVDWQNGPDAIQLRDANGIVVDAIQYGDAGPFNAGEGTPAPTVASGQSLSRDSLGTDTQDNLADFAWRGASSPGIGPQPPGPQVTVSLPDTAVTGGDTLTVPVRFTDTSGLGLVATEIFLTYDGDLLTPVDVLPADLVDTLQWQLAAHAVEGQGTAVDTLRIALATDIDTLSGAGALVHVRFAVADLRHPAASAMAIAHLALNDGQPTANAENGALRLVGASAILVLQPNPIQLHESLHVAIADADEDRNPAAIDTIVASLVEGPEGGAPEQVESLLAVETAPDAGVFDAAIAIAFGVAASGNGILETAPRRQIRLCYEDSLDAAGATATTCSTLFVPAHDGRLAATVVVQPGDTLWLRLTEADLDTRPGAIDSATVTAITTGAAVADTHAVTLVEIAVRDSVFFGFVATATAPDSLHLAVAGGDTVGLTYLDRTPVTGDSALVSATTQALALFGDADANGQVQAFDASQALRHVLAPLLSARDSLAANVDSLAPFSPITPYDAAIILQHRVGLRRRFPVQESSAANHPTPAPPSAGKVAAAPNTQLAGSTDLPTADVLALRWDRDHLSLWLGDRSHVVSGDLLLEGIDLERAQVELAPDLGAFLLAARPLSASHLRIVFAGAMPASGPGDLLRVYLRGDSLDPAAARLVYARLNDGEVIGLTTAPSYTPRPVAFALHANHPNPFNPQTVIPFDLPQANAVRLDILDLLGQPVRHLVAGELPPGPGRIIWDGHDDLGRPAATGVYLVRLRAGPYEQTRRMLLLR